MVTSARLRTGILLVLFTAVSALLLAGCSKTPPPTTGTEKAPEQAQPAPAPAEEPLHTSTVKVTGTELAVIKTSKGTITFKFFAKDAPNTVASFIELADKKFYDGTKFHRVEPGFVIQGGDPLTKDPGADPQLFGTGNPGFRLKAEFNAKKHVTGAVAMARAEDPDSAGSQFYITLAPQPMLDDQYTVFGQVVSGMDVVKKITKGDRIVSMTIVRD
jgi:peptidyl-prolyl cis-trans isomerase B (cyclophilin B)